MRPIASLRRCGRPEPKAWPPVCGPSVHHNDHDGDTTNTTTPRAPLRRVLRGPVVSVVMNPFPSNRHPSSEWRVSAAEMEDPAAPRSPLLDPPPAFRCAALRRRMTDQDAAQIIVLDTCSLSVLDRAVPVAWGGRFWIQGPMRRRGADVRESLRDPPGGTNNRGVRRRRMASVAPSRVDGRARRRASGGLGREPEADQDPSRTGSSLDRSARQVRRSSRAPEGVGDELPTNPGRVGSGGNAHDAPPLRRVRAERFWPRRNGNHLSSAGRTRPLRRPPHLDPARGRLDHFTNQSAWSMQARASGGPIP